jgi:DNA-binding GntR family transcriptional regulator
VKHQSAPKTISQQVYERLRDEVLTGSLHPGVWIREQDIASAWSVSRTPVREAVRRLAHDGLVESSPNRGVRVRVLTAQEVRDVYELREMLEGTAARRAAERAGSADVEHLWNLLARIDALPPSEPAAHIRADEALHDAIVAIAGNEALFDLTRRLYGRVARVKVISRDTNTNAQTRAQHHAIVAAIAARDPDAAERAMREHIRTFSDIVAERLGTEHSATPEGSTAGASARLRQRGEADAGREEQQQAAADDDER